MLRPSKIHLCAVVGVALITLLVPRQGTATVGSPLSTTGTHSFSLLQQIAFNTEFDFLSRYVWRGLVSSRGFVWQPSVTASVRQISLSVWANFPLDHEPNQFEFNEVDLVFSYNPTIKDLDLTFLLRGELYPDANPKSPDYGSSELVTYFRTAYPFGPLALATSAAVSQVAAAGALYGTLEAGYERTLWKDWGFKTTVLFGYANRRFNKRYITDVGARINHFQFSLTVPWRAWRDLTVSPTMSVSTLLPRSLHEAVAEPTLVWGGVMLNYNF
jgi:hypothetical protein